MVGVWSLVVVAICLLLVMFSFVIVGAVLMTYNLTPESQLVSQYNAAVVVLLFLVFITIILYGSYLFFSYRDGTMSSEQGFRC